MTNAGFDERTGIPSEIKELSFDEKRRELLKLFLDKVYSLDEKELTLNLISHKKYLENRKNGGTELEVRSGDIVYIDFHEAYNYECGYAHLALVLKVSGYKAFIVPLTSNKNACEKATTEDSERFYYLGKRCSSKESCAFLNDARWINLARVNRVIEQYAVRPYELHKIKERIFELIL